MACNLIDLRCIFVNELFGTLTLTFIALTIVYFIVASKLKFGFEMTIYGGLLVVLALSIAFGKIQIVLAFATVLVAILVANLFNRFIQ